MRRFVGRGLDLEQIKEPAVSNPIESFLDVKSVFLPVSEELCVAPNETVKAGKLVSRGLPPDSIDSFASVNGVAVAVGGFECEKFSSQQFLKVDVLEKLKEIDFEKIEAAEVSDEDVLFACEKCGILNNTDKKTLSEIYAAYPNGVENLIIDAVDDEPYVSNKTAQLIFRQNLIVPAIKALNRLFNAKHIHIEVYTQNSDITIKIPEKIGKYHVIEKQKKYPVSRTMYSSEDTVYIDIEALLSFFYSAVLKRPWTNTVITVAGDCVKRPRNIEAPIGTPIGDILNFCGLKSRPKTVILGGSMTGYMVDGVDTPVLRSTKAILAFEDELSYESATCIGCGKCIDVCPEELLPYYIYTYYLDNNIEKLYMLSADKCTECGCCSYICPAKIDLRQYVKMSRRTLLKEMWQNEQSGQNNESAVSER